jgi:ABC-type transport system substrate-binding protein
MRDTLNNGEAAMTPGAAPGAGATADAQPRRGGSVTISYQTTPWTLDPAVSWEVTDNAIAHMIFQGFFRYAPSPGAAGTRLEPCLAVEVPERANGGISDDGTVITIRLREGAMFHPPVSREVTADDFKYSFERMMNPRVTPLAPATYFYTGVAGAKEFYDGRARSIAGFEAVGRHTVRISLTQPDPSFLNALTLEFCDVVPREWVERWGAEFGKHPLGTGPFVFERWTANREVVLVRNPSYWEDGLPYLDEVKYALSFAPDVALRLLKSGTVDCLGDGIPPGDVAAIESDPDWRDCVRTQPLIATTYLFLNVQMRPFDDPRVRRAVSWAIDREKLERMLAGTGKALHQLYPPGLPGHQPDKIYYGYDPARARELLAEAGLPNGFSTSVYCDNVTPSPQLMRAVCDDLAAVGVVAEVKPLSNASFVMLQGTPRALTTGAYAWWMDFPDPVDWIAPLFTQSASANSGVNSSFWSSPVLDRMLTEAQSLTDPQARLARFQDMQDFIMEEAPYVTLFSMARTTMCAPIVGGFYLHPVYEIDPTSFWRWSRAAGPTAERTDNRGSA